MWQICFSDQKKAIEYHEACLNIAKEKGDKIKQESAYGNIGNAYYSLGNFKKAIVHYELFLKVAEEVGDRGRKRITFINLSKVTKTYEILRER